MARSVLARARRQQRYAWYKVLQTVHKTGEMACCVNKALGRPRGGRRNPGGMHAHHWYLISLAVLTAAVGFEYHVVLTSLGTERRLVTNPEQGSHRYTSWRDI